MAHLAQLTLQRQKLAPIFEAAKQALSLGVDRLPEGERQLARQKIEVAHAASAQLAEVAISLRDHASAIELLEQALALKSLPTLHKRLAEVLAAEARPREAAAHFEAALRGGLRDVATLTGLARALKLLGLGNRAAEAYRAILTLDPNHLEALRDLSFHAMLRDDFEAALALARHMAEVAPQDFTAHFYLGQALQGLGREEEARTAYDGALAIDPGNTDAMLLYGMLHRFEPDEPRLRTMLALHPQLADNPARRLKLGFALYKALNDTNRHDEAFAFLEEANRLRRAQFPAYRLEDDEKLMAELEAFFPPASLTEKTEALEERGCGEEPIFIVGLPRSGTSLTEQILASHPAIFGAGEVESLSHIVAAKFFASDRKTLLPSQSITAQALADAAEAYLAPLRAKAQGRRITDKMPVNLLWVGFIRRIFPRAKIIITRRDALANGFALYSTFFSSDGMVYSYDQSETARYILAERRLTDHWLRLFPDHVTLMNYETLTDNQEAETRRLLEFCGLPWHDGCLAFHETRRVVKTLSSAQVRQGMYSGRDRKTQHYRKHLEPMIRLLEHVG
ncbi:sulfotransferase [Allorhizobium undicola]|uniref:tetratricopeptide repeat-containing sulfotransferase family protein n=1 Tax=Allorhizobium undicola TaxID=78527 RepID=UPI003D34E6F4